MSSVNRQIVPNSHNTVPQYFFTGTKIIKDCFCWNIFFTNNFISILMSSHSLFRNQRWNELSNNCIYECWNWNTWKYASCRFDKSVFTGLMFYKWKWLLLLVNCQGTVVKNDFLLYTNSFHPSFYLGDITEKEWEDYIVMWRQHGSVKNNLILPQKLGVLIFQ